MRTFLNLFGLATCLTFCASLQAAVPPSSSALRAMTDAGTVEGEMEHEVVAFRGIPFARAPIGQRRFRAAERPAPWPGVRPALDFMPACPQVVDTDWTENNNSLQSEDCLGVNVWTPNVEPGKRPVMVFIHGGAFIAGSARNTWYSGARLAARGDVVVVTLQYRLGALGFLELADIAGNDYAESGNLGILDQIEALRWVQRNIAAFGGDPANVTIFGESVGATSIAILMGLPQARGLFAKAILESNSAARVGHEKRRASELAHEFMKSAGVSTVTELQSMSMQQLRTAQDKFFDEVFGDSSFGPTWGDVVVPEPPMKTLLEGHGARVPVLLGTNLDEILYWQTIEELPLDQKPEAILKSQLEPIVGPKAQAVIDTYRQGADGLGDAILKLETDLLFRMTSVRMAERISPVQPTYMYLFTYRSTSPFGKLGSSHAMELPFVFGNIDDLDAVAFIGRDVHRRALMDQMQGAWLAFARSGDPSHSGLPAWPRYDTIKRATMQFGIESEVVNDPQGSQRAAWEGVPFDNLRPTGAQVSVLLTDNAPP